MKIIARKTRANLNVVQYEILGVQVYCPIHYHVQRRMMNVKNMADTTGKGHISNSGDCNKILVRGLLRMSGLQPRRNKSHIKK